VEIPDFIRDLELFEKIARENDSLPTESFLAGDYCLGPHMADDKTLSISVIRNADMCLHLLQAIACCT